MQIGARERRMLGLGFVSALVIYVIPFTRFVFSALVTLFHELGHTVAGWLLGYPSLPAFDLVYGGGFTHQGTFRLPIVILAGCALAYITWLNRENRKWLAVMIVISLVWLLFVTREWRRELIIAAAGHLGELTLAGVLLYKSITGEGWRNPDLERPAAAFAAFFVQIHSTHFFWKLLHDPAFLDWYREGKGGALMNDLEVIALDLQIWLNVGPGIEGVAKWMLAFSIVPTIVAVVQAYRKEEDVF
jgi:hypothetical protein